MTIPPNQLQVPRAAVIATIEDVVHYGREDVETGGFFLGPAGSERITVVAHAGSRGITRRRGLFQVSELALDALFAHADERELWVLALYHSHRGAARMSDCDVQHGLAVPEFVSVIVPGYRNPPADASAWGWWRFDADWVPIGPPTASDGEVTTLLFEEGGVRGA